MAETVVKKDIILNNVRIDRVSLTRPFQPKVPQIDSRTKKEKPPKYHVDAIFPQTHQQFTELQALIRNVTAASWGDKTPMILETIKNNNQRFCLQRGDLHRAGKAAYEGMLYISAGNETQPLLLAQDPSITSRPSLESPAQLTPADEQYPYAGSYCNVHLQFYTYDYSGPGLGCAVLGVQFNHHGPRLTGATVSSGKEFGKVNVGDADKPVPSATGSGGLI